MSDKKKDYIVIKKGVCIKGTTECSIDDVIKLTEAKAACLVGKIRLASDRPVESVDIIALTKQLEASEQANADLVVQITELSEQLAKKGK